MFVFQKKAVASMIEKSENRQPFFSINTTNHNLLSPFQTTAVSCLHHLPTTPSGPQPLARFAHHRLRGFRRIGHSEKEGLCEQAPNAFLFTMPCPDSMLQHIFNKYPIPSGTVLYKHMSHRPNQLPILYNRAAAHD